MASRGTLATVGLSRALTAEAVRQVAEDQGVCVGPMLRRVTDRHTGAVEQVALPCGSTRESVYPPCAAKARRVRMQQCAEGWHLEDDPLHSSQEAEEDVETNGSDASEGPGSEQHRRVRSTPVKSPGVV
jgi:hypothetical protein